MTEWQVVGVIVVLIGLVTAIVTPIIKLNTSVVKLTTIVDKLAKDMDNNSESHKDMECQLNDHETRITVLEHTNG